MKITHRQAIDAVQMIEHLAKEAKAQKAKALLLPAAFFESGTNVPTGILTIRKN